MACSHCNGVGHSDRDCKENVLRQIEEQRLRKEKMQHRMREESDVDNEVLVCVDISENEIEEGGQSSSDANEDAEFISLLDSLGRV